jgi:large conductance mechanosensitive channel
VAMLPIEERFDFLSQFQLKVFWTRLAGRSELLWVLYFKKEKRMGLISEFKEFAMKGSVVDLAVGVVIGGAFGKIVTSLVNDIIMPPIGVLMGGVDFSSIKIIIKRANDAVTPKIPAVTINIGTFINNIIDFLIVAASIFVVIKLMNTAKRQPPPPPAAPPPPTKEEVLLGEIRDAILAKE